MSPKMSPIVSMFRRIILIISVLFLVPACSYSTSDDDLDFSFDIPRVRPPDPDPLFASGNDFDIRSGVTVLAFSLGFSGSVLDSDVGMADFSEDVDFLIYDSIQDVIDLDVRLNGRQIINELFRPRDIDLFESDFSFRAYEKHLFSFTPTTLVVLKPNDPVYNFSHVTYGVWVNDPDTFFYDLSIGSVVFGFPTAVTDIPTTGHASYFGLFFGGMERFDEVFLLDGDAFINVDFLSGDVVILIDNVVGTEINFGRRVNFFGWTGLGSIVNGENLFLGIFLSDADSYVGEFSGSFFGPANPLPPEVGGLWSATNARGEVAGGGFIGRR